MAIPVRHLEEWKRLAGEARTSMLHGTAHFACPRCADLGKAVLRLTREVEELRAPYARAFHDGASGALDFAARTFDALGQRGSASILRELRGVVDE